MAYTSNFVQLRIHGAFGNTSASENEHWSVGLKLLNTGAAPTFANLLAFLTAIYAPVADFHTNLNVKAGSNVWISEFSAAYVGTDGKYVGGASQDTTRLIAAPRPQGNGVPTGPYTQALVTSLRTPLSRGRASNGRMYWPFLAGVIDSATGTVPSGHASAYATQAATMLSAINAQADLLLSGTQGIAVMSNVGAGTTALVTHVRIGNHMDRQERRENDIVETYAQANVTALSGLIPDRSHWPIGT